MSDEYGKKCSVCEAAITTEGADKCDYCLSLDEKYKDNTGPKKEKKPKVKDSCKYVEVVCSACGQIKKVRTSTPEIYTDEVRKTWKCFVCLNPGTTKNKWQL